MMYLAIILGLMAYFLVGMLFTAALHCYYNDTVREDDTGLIIFFSCAWPFIGLCFALVWIGDYAVAPLLKPIGRGMVGLVRLFMDICKGMKNG